MNISVGDVGYKRKILRDREGGSQCLFVRFLWLYLPSLTWKGIESLPTCHGFSFNAGSYNRCRVGLIFFSVFCGGWFEILPFCWVKIFLCSKVSNNDCSHLPPPSLLSVCCCMEDLQMELEDIYKCLRSLAYEMFYFYHRLVQCTSKWEHTSAPQKPQKYQGAYVFHTLIKGEAISAIISTPFTRCRWEITITTVQRFRVKLTVEDTAFSR